MHSPGTDWEALSSTDGPDDCDLSCQNGGLCLPQVKLLMFFMKFFLGTYYSSQQANSSSYCMCAPGFTGRTCALASTSCAETPCLHGAECVDSSDSNAGYMCDCNGTGHSGAFCQKELNHCAGSPCGPGLCLPQPGGFLCQCPPDRAGSTCANKPIKAMAISSLQVNIECPTWPI